MDTNKKHRIVLFQPVLRKHILNFGKYLKNFEFIVKKPIKGNFYSTLPSSYEKEINRIKTNRINKLRRFFGIPNFRIKFDSQAEIFFTYGCMLITNKPYCVYIENGVAAYNYDHKIAKRLFARLIFSFLARQKNCKKLIFMSQAGKKSFFSTVTYDKTTLGAIKKKSIQIYPLIENKEIGPKKLSANIKLLFVGVFYMKGGIELVNAFQKIRKKYQNITLTIITPFQTVNTADIERFEKIQGLTILDAVFNEEQMSKFYKNHDIFILPTFRDGFGLVLVEAISWGMPIICNDQYATSEVAIDNCNAFVYPNHPLKDYEEGTFRLLGKYSDPKYFYSDLFKFQKEGKTKPIEDFIYLSIEKFILDPNLLEKFSNNSLELYNKKFHHQLISKKIEEVFSNAIKKND